MGTREASDTHDSTTRRKRASAVAHVETSVSERTSDACRSASSWATVPPIESPTTWARTIFSSRKRAAASSASCAVVYTGSGGRSVSSGKTATAP